jgi:putative FmdB family regulatory protein
VPTYQYACSDCGHDFEAFQSFSDDALTECPVCHGRLRKVFNSVGIVFKGSGFYRTDSREKAGAGSGREGKSGDRGRSESATSDGGGGKESKSTGDGAKSKGDGAKSTSSSGGSTSSGSSSSSSSSTAGSAA